jgi:hypothetical protein
MGDLEKYTPTELLKLINDSNIEHESLKKEIVTLTYNLEEIEEHINEKLMVLDAIEKRYVILIEELNTRENAIR